MASKKDLVLVSSHLRQTLLRMAGMVGGGGLIALGVARWLPLFDILAAFSIVSGITTSLFVFLSNFVTEVDAYIGNRQAAKLQKQLEAEAILDLQALELSREIEELSTLGLPSEFDKGTKVDPTRPPPLYG